MAISGSNLLVTLIGVVIFVLIATSLGENIVESTYDGACDYGTGNRSTCGLQNASATGKSMLDLVEVLYFIVPVMFIVAIAFKLK